MRAGPAEIRWHSTQPIYSVDFQPIPADEYKKQFNPYERAAKSEEADQSLWRLATAGGDNQVRLWLVTPLPNSTAPPKGAPGAGKGPDPARVEYLSTLSKHQGVVNCVRFAPFGAMLASAGDDGTIIIWVPGDKPTEKTFGNDVEDDMTYAREFWKARRVMRSTQQEVYDLAWSPDGEMIIAGSTDNTARIYRVQDGTCIQQITDHNNYVQGVAWDPLNHFVATQSSDRQMHVYGIKAGSHGAMSISLVGKNSKLDVRRKDEPTTDARQSRSPGTVNLAHPKPVPASAAMATTVSSSSANGQSEEHFERPPPPRRSQSRASDSDRSEAGSSIMHPPTTATSASGRPSSRRSSFSGSPPVEPMTSRIARSPSPVPPLPAIRTPLDHPVATPSSPSAPAPTPLLAPPVSRSVNLYGGQDTSPFFRRLAWSTDGSLLLTPAGLFADPFANSEERPKKRQRKSSENGAGTSSVTGTPSAGKTSSAPAAGTAPSEAKPTVYIHTRAGIANGPVAHLPGHKTGAIAIRFNPILFSMRNCPPASTSPPRVNLQPGAVETVSLPVDIAEASTSTSTEDISAVFKLPHRMVYAVATHDAVLVYDTQQSTPLCYFGNLHYAPFTDVAWTADGQTLVLASQDGYCSLAAFAPGELGTPLPEEEQIKRVKPVVVAPVVEEPVVVASSSTAPAPAVVERAAAPVAIDVDGGREVPIEGEPKAKKRRVALTYEGPV